MPPKVIPSSINCLYDYVIKCFKTNPDYIDEDLEWMLFHFNNIYTDFILNINNLYIMLAITNISSFCGYFALKYNNLLTKCVKERDAVSFKNTLLNPKIYEVVENTHLENNEKRELLDILTLESMVANLTIKRMIVNKNNDIDSLYIDSYNELYEKLFIDKISNSRVNFQEFIFITEFNSKTGNSHVYTYRLVDILSQCISNKFTYEISENNINNIKKRFNLELKIVQYALE
jgi:hypothetical protein